MLRLWPLDVHNRSYGGGGGGNYNVYATMCLQLLTVTGCPFATERGPMMSKECVGFISLRYFINDTVSPASLPLLREAADYIHRYVPGYE